MHIHFVVIIALRCGFGSLNHSLHNNNDALKLATGRGALVATKSENRGHLY